MSELTCQELQRPALDPTCARPGDGPERLPLDRLPRRRPQREHRAQGRDGGPRPARASPTISRTSPPSSPSILAFITLHFSAGVWPAVWIVSRAFYLPLYLFGVVYARWIVWGVSLVALVMMLIRLSFVL